MSQNIKTSPGPKFSERNTEKLMKMHEIVVKHSMLHGTLSWLFKKIIFQSMQGLQSDLPNPNPSMSSKPKVDADP